MAAAMVPFAAATPALIPQGCRLRAKTRGIQAGGFWNDESQLAVTYERDSLTAFTIHMALSPEAALLGTERRTGVVVGIKFKGVTAVYHDGWWTPGRGLDEQRAGDIYVHWDTSDAHSLTIRTDALVVGLRGSRANGIGLSQLLELAESTPALSKE